MSDSIFNGETTPEVVTPTEIQLPPEVSEFVGEGKKYRSAEEALKAVPHAQKHIQTLEQEMAQLREEVSKRKAAEELLEEIKSGIVQPSEVTPTSKNVDPEEIYKTVSKVIEQREAQQSAQINISEVTKTFTDKFGTKAEEVYVKLANDTGLSIPELNKLAARSPTAVFKLAGFVPQQSAPVGKITSSVNTESLHQGNNEPLSARVPQGASTKDMVNAWKIAGEKVKQQLQST